MLALAGVLGDDFADAATRFGFEPPTLAFAGGLRLETLAAFAVLAAAFLTGRDGLPILAEIFASLLLLDELDFDDRLIAFAGRTDDFFGAFFRVDMADLLLKSSGASHDKFTALTARSLVAQSLAIHIAGDPDRDRADRQFQVAQDANLRPPKESPARGNCSLK